MAFEDNTDQYDRVTSILQQRTQPQTMPNQALSIPPNILNALTYSAMANGGNVADSAINYQNQSQDRALNNQMGILKVFEAKKAAGDAQAKALDDKISLFTGGDPEGQALFLQALHDDPEDIDPSNSYQVMTKLAGIKKKTGYVSPIIAMAGQKRQLEAQKLQSEIFKNEQGDLKEVYDANSPTGTKWVREADAIGSPGKPGHGTKVSVGPDGAVTFEDGSGLMVGGGSGLGKPTTGKIEEKLLNSTEMLSRLASVEKTFKPQYLQLGTRVGMAGKELKDFVGAPLNQKEQNDLIDYSQFRQNSIENINRTLNELSGAAVSPSEETRLKGGQPNAGTGIFDGDSPTKFKAKLENTSKNLRNAVLRYNFALANGLNPLKTGVELKDVPALIERKGAEIEAQVKQELPNATQPQIDMETKARLTKEFGMR